MNTILLIEDDVAIAKQLKIQFEHWDIKVEVVTNFKNIMPLFHELSPALVIIDIQLPIYDGFHWCREIRLHSQVPIIFLSSRDQPLDMIMAMQIGADDYIQKPFHRDVLLTKVQALLRRTYEYTQQPTQIQLWNEAEIDYARSTIKRHSVEQHLTKNEQFILQILVENKNKIVSRDELMRKLWEDERFVNDNTLTVNVNRLRTKLRELGMENTIETKKGLGYIAITEED